MCGTYKIANGKIIFQWADGKVESSSFTYRLNNQGVEEISFQSVNWLKLLPWNKPLKGEYTSSHFDAGLPDHDTRFPNFSTAAGLTVTFTPFGECDIRQFTSATGERKIKTTYEVKGGVLKLHYPNAKIRECSLHVLAGNPSNPEVDVIYINGRPFIQD